jgi:integrase
MKMLVPAQAQRLLDTVVGHRWAGVYRIALELGLRRGEILALRWVDIDLLTWNREQHRGGRSFRSIERNN